MKLSARKTMVYTMKEKKVYFSVLKLVTEEHLEMRKMQKFKVGGF